MLRRRLLATSIALGLIAGALTGCVRNQPIAAVDWLDRQGGIVDAVILSDNTDAWSSSGLVHGELQPDIDDAGIKKLLEEIQGFWRDNGAVSFRLGWHGVDFAVSDDDAENDISIDLWHTLIDTPSVETGVAYAGSIDAHTMRDGTLDALNKLDPLDVDLWIEAFSDERALADDTEADYQYNGYASAVALGYWLPADCDPDAAVLEFAESLVDRSDIEGGSIAPCAEITLGLPSGSSLAAAATAQRSELDERGLPDFPVTMFTAETGYYDTYTAAITPGDPAALAVLQTFEQDAHPELFYELDAERALTVTAYETPTSDLLALVQSSPASAALPQITLIGAPVTVYGPLAALPSLLDKATALDAASDAFGSIELGVDAGSAFFDYEVGSAPDVVKAAADLRASGVTEGRTFTMKQKSYELYIIDGVAEIADPDYVGAESMLEFVDVWNAGG